MAELWIVGQYRDHFQWQFAGVFDSEQKAIAACRNRSYWVRAEMLNITIPDQTTEDFSAYYPWARDKDGTWPHEVLPTEETGYIPEELL